MDPNGVGVQNFHSVQHVWTRRAAELVCGINEALDAELYRLRLEVLSVVELDALPKPDLPQGRRDGSRQLRGQAWDRLEGFISLDERLEDLSADVRRRCLLVVRHIESAWIGRLGNNDLAVGSSANDIGGRSCDSENKSHAPHLATAIHRDETS